jgi:hypothetical protein
MQIKHSPTSRHAMQSANRLLARLLPEELGVLQPHLQAVDLPVRTQLEARNKPIDAVYFIEHGIASVVANGTDRAIEVGLIGREGMTGLAVIRGTDRSPHETFMQVSGDGQRILDAIERLQAKAPAAAWPSCGGLSSTGSQAARLQLR